MRRGVASFGALLLLAAASAQADVGWRNATAGGPLRHGVYGQIVFKGPVAPPVIYSQPLVASQPVGAVAEAPVYLYVPPGQVRKWDRHCMKWNACDRPVYFVRMDNSPSRLGQWKYRDAPDTSVMGASPAPAAAPTSRSSRP